MSQIIAARRISIAILAGVLVACAGPKPFLMQGDASAAQVGFAGDVEAATLVAKQHCARYERVPRFLEAQENVAYFDCLQP